MTDQFNNDISQKERREILESDRRARKDTYFSHAEAQADLDAPQGRFAKETPTHITASGRMPAGQVPKQPPSSPWHSDPVPPGEPLGYSVNAQEPTGSRAEQIEAEKLLAARGAARSQPSATPSSIRRRI